ncbi:hypothetical protein TYRP_019536 [Tyrophagus putrescentiae]|nr:hypothetical protein TYRP_019536 [Tyrophagus putrescentiae]
MFATSDPDTAANLASAWILYMTSAVAAAKVARGNGCSSSRAFWSAEFSEQITRICLNIHRCAADALIGWPLLVSNQANVAEVQVKKGGQQQIADKPNVVDDSEGVDFGTVKEGYNEEDNRAYHRQRLKHRQGGEQGEVSSKHDDRHQEEHSTTDPVFLCIGWFKMLQQLACSRRHDDHVDNGACGFENHRQQENHLFHRKKLGRNGSGVGHSSSFFVFDALVRPPPFLIPDLANVAQVEVEKSGKNCTDEGVQVAFASEVFV